jgi:hypothetical protein
MESFHSLCLRLFISLIIALPSEIILFCNSQPTLYPMGSEFKVSESPANAKPAVANFKPTNGFVIIFAGSLGSHVLMGQWFDDFGVKFDT